MIDSSIDLISWIFPCGLVTKLRIFSEICKSLADVLFFEIHPNPDKALCDGPNMLFLKDAESVFEKCNEIFKIIRN